MDFKNPACEAMVTVIIDHAIEFENRKRGQTYKAILMSIASLFPEDRHAIYLRIGKPVKEPKPTGGARIIRGGNHKKADKPPCDDCGQTNAAGADGPQGARAITMRPRINRSKAAIAFKTASEVMDRFEGNPTAMKAYAQSQNITLPANVSKGETIAKYIAAHYAKDEEE